MINVKGFSGVWQKVSLLSRDKKGRKGTEKKGEERHGGGERKEDDRMGREREEGAEAWEEEKQRRKATSEVIPSCQWGPPKSQRSTGDTPGWNTQHRSHPCPLPSLKQTSLNDHFQAATNQSAWIGEVINIQLSG